MESVQQTIDWVYKTYLEPLIRRDNQGKLYINENEFNKVISSNLEKSLAEKILEEKNVLIQKPITKKDRPILVRDFQYGEITENKQNSADLPNLATIRYDEHGEIEEEDFEKLDRYLEEEFIPQNVEIKILSGDHYGEPYLSIQLNKIVSEGFSEIEIKHILDFLQKEGIKVRGKNEDLESHANFEYHYGLKNTQTPKRIEKYVTIKLFYELEKYKNDERIDKLKEKIEEQAEKINQQEKEIEKCKTKKKLSELQEKKKELEQKKKELENKLVKECSKEKNDFKRREIIEKIEDGNAKLADWCLYKYYKSYGLNFHEWKAIAYEGLWKAILNFEVEQGNQFSTFAVVVIRRYLIKEISEHFGIPMIYIYSFLNAMKNIEKYREKKYVPGDKEMLEQILDLLVYQNIITQNQKGIYLRGHYTFLEDEKNLNNTSDPDYDLNAEIEQYDMKKTINEVLYTLTQRESTIIKLRYGLDLDINEILETIKPEGIKILLRLRYGLDMDEILKVSPPLKLEQFLRNRQGLDNKIKLSLEETGQIFGVSGDRIRQIEAKALRKLRHYSRSKKLSPYLYDYQEPLKPGQYIKGHQGEYINIPSDYYEPETSKRLIKRIINKQKELIYEQLQEDMKDDLEIISSPNEEPTRLALAIINILKGKKKEIPSGILNKLEKEIELLNSSPMKRILKLRLGLSDYPRPLTYKEIQHLEKGDIEELKAIMMQALKHFKQKEFEPDDVQINLITLPLEETKKEIIEPTKEKIEPTKEKAMENDNQQTLNQYENEHGISLSQLRELLRDIKTLLAELNDSKEEKERKI